MLKDSYAAPNKTLNEKTPLRTMKGVREWRNERNGYYCIEIHYSADPEKDNDGFKKACKEGITEQKYRQEYEIDWTVTDGTPVWAEYDETIHRRFTEYEPRYPLFAICDPGVWSLFLFCQLTDYGQFRVIGADMNMAVMKAEQHCQRAQIKLNTEYPSPKYFDLIADIAIKKTESTTDYNWEVLLEKYFDRKPISYAMQGKNDGAIDLVGASFLQWVINPETGKQEPKILISHELDYMHTTLKSGYRWKEQRDLAAPKSVQIEEVHPFEEYADCLKYGIYHVFSTDKRDKKLEERKKKGGGIQMVARYNR